MKKLLAIDVDGTLLNSKGIVTDSTRQALTDFCHNDGEIMICSARPLLSLQKLIVTQKLGFVRYASALNSAQIFDLNKKEPFIESFFLKNELRDINERVNLESIEHHFFNRENIVQNANRTISPFTQYESQVFDIPVVTASIATIFNSTDIFKITIVTDVSSRSTMSLRLKLILGDDYECVETGANYIDIQPKGVNKGRAVAVIANQLSVNRNDIISIGDHENDAFMFQRSGISIAMGNGTKNIKEIATFVTKSHDEDGVAYALKTLI